MTDDGALEYRCFRWTRWGPARVARRGDTIEATVGDATVALDLTDRRPALERQQDRFRSVFLDGVPVEWNGRHVATVTTAAGGPVGLVRRQRHDVTGDGDFVLPGMRFTERALPTLLTLRCDTGTLASSRRWASPLNMAVEEWSYVREHDLVPPRVARTTRDEHIALWLAMRESR